MITFLRNIKKTYTLNKKLSKKGNFGSFWNYRKGFLKLNVDINNITKSNYKNFLSDRDYLSGHKYNGAYSTIIDNKLWLPFLLKDYKEYLPQYYYFKDYRGFHRLKLFNPDFNDELHTAKDVLVLLKDEKKLVCKHTHSAQSKGFILLEYKQDEIYCNNKVTSKEEFYSLVNSLENYIVTEYVNQHPYANKVAPSSLNTMRFLILTNTDTHKNELVRCYHKFGCNNMCYDNGIIVYINPLTGISKGEGFINEENKNLYYQKNIVHPDSQIPMKNFQIINFLKTKEKLLEITNSFPFLCYLGIDVAITNDGFKIIEINSLTGLKGIQEKGLLKDEVTRKFFAEKIKN
jgi:hypothetical protein